MLGWLAAAAAPIVIHLLTRRRYREEPWAAMEFLLAAMRKAARRVRIEQLLLLAVRTMIVVLIVLAVARLRWRQTPGTTVAGQPTLKVLVIDRSFSMGHRKDDTTRFDEAKSAAVRRIGTSHAGDAFLVVLMGEPPEVIVEEPAFFPAKSLVAELNDPTAIRLYHRGADLAATLTKVHELVKHNLKRFPRFGAAEVFCFTDMARHTWAKNVPEDNMQPTSRGISAAALERIEQLRDITADRLYVVDVGAGSSENTAVTDVHVESPYATVGRPVRIDAKVKHLGSQPRRDMSVEVLIDGERVKQFQLDIAAGQEVAVPSFEHTFDAPGDHLIEVRTESDELVIDDHRWAAVRVEPALRVLCINGRPENDPLRDGAKHLVMALSALDQPNQLSQIQTRVVLESELLSASVDLSQYHAVIVSNVAEINREESKLLRRYLVRGGAVVFFLGDRVQADAYNRNLHAAQKDQPPILPVTIGQVVRGPLAGFEMANYENAITHYFRGQRGPGLGRPLVGSYYRLKVDPEAGARVLLDFASGDPAIVAHDVGRGRCVVVATSATVDPAGDSVWSAMPREKLYVPLIHKILESAVSGQLLHNTVKAGEPLSLSVRTGVPTVHVRLDLEQPGDGPPRKLIESEYSLDKNGGRWLFADTNFAGVYRLRLKAPVEQRAQFAVNVDTAESDLVRVAEDELADGLVALKLGEDIDPLSAAALAPRYDPAHATLLYAVLGLLFVEMILAWRFGHRSL